LGKTCKIPFVTQKKENRKKTEMKDMGKILFFAGH